MRSVGPRSAWGPAAPLTPEDAALLATALPVQGRTAVDVQAACTQAVQIGRPVVLLSGAFLFDRTVTVPAGVTVMGDGSTQVTAAGPAVVLFKAGGDNGRLTRLTLVGGPPVYNTANFSRGLQVTGRQNIRVDHCDLSGFAYGVLLEEQAWAQVDHCFLHHNLTAGLGYGVMVSAGAYALVLDNEFSQNRISLASSGAIDNSTKATGTYQLRPDVRPPYWELKYNWLHGDDESPQHQVPVDTHPSMNGSFVVENNLFENLIYGCGFRDGSGMVRYNQFRDFVSFNHAAPVAFWIRWTTQDGIPVAGAMPHDIALSENIFEAVPAYRIIDGVNITVDGVLVKPPLNS